MPAWYRIDIRSDARRNLLEIMNYVAFDNPSAAERLYEDLVAGIASFRAVPLRGSVVSDVSRMVGMEIRRLLASSYSILYRVCENEVIVYRVIHTRRDREMHLAMLDILDTSG